MRYFLIVTALVFASVTAASACSGVKDYPKAIKALESNQHLSAEQKDILMKDLMAGKSMHDEGYKTGDMSKMGQSLKILRSVKSRIKNQ